MIMKFRGWLQRGERRAYLATICRSCCLYKACLHKALKNILISEIFSISHLVLKKKKVPCLVDIDKMDSQVTRMRFLGFYTVLIVDWIDCMLFKRRFQHHFNF